MAENKEALIHSWYEQYRAKLLRYFLAHISDRQDAEDLVQTVFLKCWRNLDNYDPEKCPEQAWLFVVAGNCLKDYYKGRKPVTSLEEEAEDHPGDLADDSQQKAVELMEKRELLQGALATLPKRSRDAVVLRYFGDYTTQQIADALGVSYANARVILTRALDQMEKYLHAQQ